MAAIDLREGRPPEGSGEAAQVKIQQSHNATGKSHELLASPPKIPATFDAWQLLQDEARRLEQTAPDSQEKALGRTAYKIGLRVGAQLLDMREAAWRLIVAGKAMTNEPGRKPWTEKQITERVVQGLLDGVAAVSPELAKLNRRHFVVRVGGKTRVVTYRDPMGEPLDMEFSTVSDFREFYADRTVEIKKEGNGDVVPRKLGAWWLRSPLRRKYDRIAFDPTGQAAPGTFNTWQGFAFEPQPGDWSLLYQHMRDNLCRGDDELLRYVLGWMAHCVQRPTARPGVALVMRGRQGTGKGVFANAFGALFGAHFLPVSHAKHLTGHFNAHLRDKLVIFADEAFWAGDKEGKGALKALITEPTLAIEAKGFDVEKTPNYVHLIVASNETWVVPTDLDERRFCVLDVGDEHAQDAAYFGAIQAQLDAGGYGAMLYDLLRWDLSDFSVQKVPQTQALLDQKAHGMSPLEVWWEDRLMDGRLYETKPGWHRAECSLLYNRYKDEASALGDKHPHTKKAFVAAMRPLLPKPGIERKRGSQGKDKKRPWMWEFPPLERCRARWDEINKTTTDWHEEDEGDDS